MALGSTTSTHEVNQVIREKAMVREEQKVALSRFQGLNAVATLSQMVGTLILFFYSFAAVGLYEGFSARTVHPLVMEVCVVLLLTSPVVSGFIFGLKNKVMSLIFVLWCAIRYLARPRAIKCTLTQ
jgi:hypothetical protein